MSWMPRYYATQDADVLGARQADNFTTNEIIGRAWLFSRRYGAEPIFASGFAPTFYGVAFNKKHPCPESALWTKLSDKRPVQEPKVMGVPQAMLQTSERLRADWKENWPADLLTPRQSLVLKVLGLSDDLLKGHMVTFMEHEGTIYLATNAPTVPLVMVEILATEFIASEVASDAKAKAIKEAA